MMRYILSHILKWPAEGKILKKFFLFVLLSAAAVSYAQDFIDAEMEEDLDSVFENASDVDSPVIKETDRDSDARAFNGIAFSGKLSSSLGGGFIRENSENDFTGYFDFKNNLYADIKDNKTYSVHADVFLELPSEESSKTVSAADIIKLREFYFNYLFASRTYITAGKKKSVWGYPRLFVSDGGDYSGRIDITGNGISYDSTMNTNILSDSLYGTTVQIRIPVWTGTISGLALYRGNSSELSMENVSWGFSAEFVLFDASINFFGRKNPNEKSSSVQSGLVKYSPHCIGAEIKRSFFGFDVYAQDIIRFKSVKKLASFWKEDDVLESSVATAGFYRMFNVRDSVLGFNFEYQCESLFNSSESQDDFMQRFFLEAGIKNLGKRHNIALGSDWFHNADASSGFVKFGINADSVFKYTDWRTGIKAEYVSSKDAFLNKLTIGSFLRFTFNY